MTTQQVVRALAGIGACALTVAALPAATAAQTRSDTTVRTATAPRNRGVATLVSETQIGGAAASADEYIFSSIGEVLPLRDGSIVVVDRGSGTSPFVRVYNKEGKYVRTLGRSGDGPGEFRSPSGVAELLDGRIVVRDGRGGRIAVYSNDGGAAQFFSMNASGTSTGPNMLTITSTGILHLRTHLRPDGGAFQSDEAFIRLRPDGTVIDTVLAPILPQFGPPPLTATRTTGRGGSSISNEVPFTPIGLSALSPLGYFVTANSGRYAVDLRTPATRSSSATAAPSMWKEGDPVISIRRTIAPVQVSDAERAEQRRSVEEDMRRLDPNWQWTGQDVPRTKPPLNFIRIALDGRIWVQIATPSERFEPANEPARTAQPTTVTSRGRSGSVTVTLPPPRPQPTWRSPILYDVLEPDGSWIGQVSVPFTTTIHSMRGDYVYGVTRDADGVETVHRFRIAWPRP